MCLLWTEQTLPLRASSSTMKALEQWRCGTAGESTDGYFIALNSTSAAFPLRLEKQCGREADRP